MADAALADRTAVGDGSPAPDQQLAIDENVRDQVWSRVQQARSVKRPHTLELLSAMATDVVELHGDRLFGDDPAIVGGFCRIEGHAVVFVGHQKGAEVEENVVRNFGMPHAEGYRKAVRLFRLAERLGLPVVTFVDTPGAYPGAASEERGVAEAIARSIQVMSGLRTPIVSVITGEGGSGGALAICVGDVVLALENAVYSVITPEGCASILWRTPDKAHDAAVAMRITALEQQQLGVIDVVIAEPQQGADAAPEETAARLREAIVAQLAHLASWSTDELLSERYGRYRRMGAFVETASTSTARPERHGITDRLRELLGSSRGVSIDGSGPLRPKAADDMDEPPLHEDL